MGPNFSNLDLEQRFAVSVMALAVIVLTVLICLSGCDNDDQGAGEVDQGPCLQSCEDFDLCFGFEGTGETLNSCRANCEETTAGENDCILDCEPIADCDQWWSCLQDC